MLPQAVQSRGGKLALAGVDQWGVLGLHGVKRLGWELLKVLGIQDLQGKTGQVSEVRGTGYSCSCSLLLFTNLFYEG